MRPKDLTSYPRTQTRETSEPRRAGQPAPVTIPQRTVSPFRSQPRLPPEHRAGVANGPGYIGEPRQTKEKATGDVTTLLAATAIPRRKKTRQRPSQRLPQGDHVAEFSKFILDDLQVPEDRSIASSLTNPQFDGLFGHPGELGPQSNVGGEEVPGSLLSVRSLSSESMPSLGNDSTATSFVDLPSPSTCAGQSAPERRSRQLSSSQECGEDHPLLNFEPLDAFDLPSPEVTHVSPSRKLPTRPTPLPNRTSTFRSNLTASLRAIKSAAQTVTSIAANPIYPPEDFLYRSDFTFAPGLTDDKRPPPSVEQPSPELRRYLNPPPTSQISPADFHVWHEAPSSSRLPASKGKGQKSKDESTATPLATPLQTCIRRVPLSSTASAPPIWLTADGTPSNRKTADSLSIGSSLARQREPRENSDYLRILVAEMNMKRNGKFSEEADSHATIWLPPRKPSENSTLAGKDRWTMYLPT